MPPQPWAVGAVLAIVPLVTWRPRIPARRRRSSSTAVRTWAALGWASGSARSGACARRVAGSRPRAAVGLQPRGSHRPVDRDVRKQRRLPAQQHRHQLRRSRSVLASSGCRSSTGRRWPTLPATDPRPRLRRQPFRLRAGTTTGISTNGPHRHLPQRRRGWTAAVGDVNGDGRLGRLRTGWFFHRAGNPDDYVFVRQTSGIWRRYIAPSAAGGANDVVAVEVAGPDVNSWCSTEPMLRWSPTRALCLAVGAGRLAGSAPLRPRYRHQR